LSRWPWTKRASAVRRSGPALVSKSQSSSSTPGGRHAGRVDAQLGPQLGDRPPVTLEPAAVLVGPVALLLPLGAWREELRVVGHIELACVLDAPAVRTVVAEQHGVGVDLLEDLEVALRLNLEDGLRARAELVDLGAGVGVASSSARSQSSSLRRMKAVRIAAGRTALLEQ
jgi:hypothetical protein